MLPDEIHTNVSSFKVISYRGLLPLAFLLGALPSCQPHSNITREEASAEESNHSWANYGLGAGTSGLAMGANLTYSVKGQCFMLRISANVETRRDYQPESVQDIGFTYGKALLWKNGVASITESLS